MGAVVLGLVLASPSVAAAIPRSVKTGTGAQRAVWVIFSIEATFTLGADELKPLKPAFINSVLTHAATCACAPSLPGLLGRMRVYETPAEKPSVAHLVALTDRLTRFDYSRFERTVFGRLERAFSG